MKKKRNLIYRQKTIDHLQKRIDLLGMKDSYDASIFLNIRIITSTILFFMILYLFEQGSIIAPVVTFLYYYFLPKFVIEQKLEKRRIHLDNDAIYFFEVLTLSLETGRNMKQALEVTSSNIDSLLSSEFKKALEEVRLGKSLNEALEELKKRIPSETVNNIILTIAQANLAGTSIVVSMYDQIDYMREKKIMEAKARISKIPVKVSVVSVVFFLPLMILLILAPIIIENLPNIVSGITN